MLDDVSMFSDNSLKSNNLYTKEVFSFYKEKEIECSLNEGKDCSEITEDFLERFDGSALLILHKGYRLHEALKFKNFNEEIEEYCYHYSFIDINNHVYDAMLNIVSDSVEDYLLAIGLKDLNVGDDFVVEIIKDRRYLKCYI